MEELLKLYTLCFPERNAETEIKALGSAFEYELLDEASFIIYRMISNDEVEIIDIGTSPTSRDKGFAKKLLKKTLDNLKNKKIKTVYLEVAENNIPAQKLYENCGFEKYNLRKDYYKQGNSRINAILMKKSI